MSGATTRANYATLGPIFTTDSSACRPRPLGIAGVKAAVGLLPVVATGGLDPHYARSVVAAGAHGVLVFEAIWRQPDPVGAAKNLVAAIDR